jgi:tRNA G18 (ribose-2'-O)-methylase SpoU
MATLIDDPDDPRVAGFRDIRERDLVGRQGQFVAEGEVVLRVLLRSALFRPRAILIDAKREPALAALLARAPEGVPVYLATQGVLDAIAGFHLHRGILALAERVAAPSAETLIAELPPAALVLGLFGISNHDNMGGIFRNAAAFGADAVLLDETCCDPLYRKAIRVSVGGVLVTPFARWTGDPLAALEAAGFETVALSPSGSTHINALDRAPRTAVLLGAEGPGLPAAVMARARTVRIPMAGEFDSLNVATTSGIVLSRLAL